MWETRKQSAFPRQAPMPPQAPEPRSEPAFTRQVNVPQQATARLGSTISIRGRIVSKEDLYIDGNFQGSLELPGCRLTVGPNGRVAANANAREVIVLGQMNGNVDGADKVSVRNTGTLIGDISTAGVVIEDEAYFKGKIDIVTHESVAAREPAAKLEPVAVSDAAD
jgi:cytoskeletal protein CcmA (bactofilin family)